MVLRRFSQMTGLCNAQILARGADPSHLRAPRPRPRQPIPTGRSLPRRLRRRRPASIHGSCIEARVTDGWGNRLSSMSLCGHACTAVGTGFASGTDAAMMPGGDLPRIGYPVDDLNNRLLQAHPSSVAAARKMVRDIWPRRDAKTWSRLQLLVSEVVTNALVHAGTPIGFHASVGDVGLRVEVSDGSTQAPAPRRYAAMAGTGRGLRLVQQLVKDWGVQARPNGKTVWFELDSGNHLDEIPALPTPDASRGRFHSGFVRRGLGRGCASQPSASAARRVAGTRGGAASRISARQPQR